MTQLTTFFMNTSTEMDDCEYASNVRSQVILYQIPVAIVIILGLAFTVQRKRLWRDKCGGRPGVLHPVNLVNESGRRRWPFAACYVIIANDILDIVYANSFDVELKAGYSSWVITLIRLLAIVVVCLVYYPLFVCLSHNRNIASNIVGFFYIIGVLIVTLWMTASCVNQMVYDTSAGGFDIAFHVPIIIASCILGATYGYDFMCNIGLLKGHSQTVVETMEHFDYVRDILVKKVECHPIPEITSSTSLWMRTLRRLLKRRNNVVDCFKYRKVSVFRYPLWLVCTITVCVLLIVLVVAIVQLFINVIFNRIDAAREKPTVDGKPIVSDEFLRTVRVVMSIANPLSAVIQIVLLWRLIVSYRRRILEHFHGLQTSNELHARLLASPDKILMKAICYPGYQMMACIFGYICTAIFIFIILLIFVYVVVRPLQYWQSNWVLDVVIKLIPSFIISACIVVVQWLFCKFLFTGRWTANRSGSSGHMTTSTSIDSSDENSGNDLILDLQNRRLFHVFTYFMFVFNFIVGFFACLRRLFVSQCVNMILVSRLDRVFYTSELISLDPCHVAFMSMVALDLSMHNIHPVARVFIEFLTNTPTSQAFDVTTRCNKSVPAEGLGGIDQRLVEVSMATAATSQLGGQGDVVDRAPTTMKRRQLRRRWQKVLMLFKNPLLVADHKKTLNARIARKQQRQQKSWCHIDGDELTEPLNRQREDTSPLTAFFV